MLRRFRDLAAKHSRAGFSVEESRVAFASVRQGKDSRLHVTAFAVERRPDDDTWRQRLADQVGGISSGRPPVFSSLPEGAYQMLLVETPDVPAAEINEAIRWQIRDLIDFPVDETVIEVFDIPSHASRSADKPMAYAVATRRSTVEEHIALLGEAGLSPHVISIPELCMRNIAALLPQDANGVALLHLTDDYGILTLSRQGLLYLIRHIDIGRNALRSADDDFSRSELIATIALELQRSLDYYESHFDRRPLAELVLTPGSDICGLADSLSQQLGLTVSRLDFDQFFDIQIAASSEEQGNCVLAIGAALRQEPLAA